MNLIFRRIYRFAKLPEADFLQLAKNQLQSLSTKVQELQKQEIDVSGNDSVLTIRIKSSTIVINRQTPNRQLWYSSPLSGPQRYNLQGDKWIGLEGRQISSVLLQDIKKLIQ